MRSDDKRRGYKTNGIFSSRDPIENSAALSVPFDAGFVLGPWGCIFFQNQGVFGYLRVSTAFLLSVVLITSRTLPTPAADP